MTTSLVVLASYLLNQSGQGFETIARQILAEDPAVLFSYLTFRTIPGDSGELDGSYPFMKIVKREGVEVAPHESLLRWGEAHLGELVSRLGDSRATRLNFEYAWTTPFYDPKSMSSDPRWMAAEDVFDANITTKDYAVTVGDICYFTLGRIVNRWFLPVRAGGGFIISSPQPFPALAKSCRRDYGLATRSDVVSQLEADIRNPDSRSREFFGIRRLLRLDRDAALRAVVARLGQVRKQGLVYKGKGYELGQPNLVIALSDVVDVRLDELLLSVLQDLAHGKGPLASEDQLGLSIVYRFLSDSHEHAAIQTYCRRRVAAGAPNSRYFEEVLTRIALVPAE